MSFSLANIIKQKRVQCEALQSVLTTKEPPGSKTWWENRKILIEDWIRSNPLRLGVPNDGCIEAMQYSLKRGDEQPNSRKKCWNHILLELQEIPDFQAGLAEQNAKANVTAESDQLVVEIFKMMARQSLDIDECSASSYYPSPRFTDEMPENDDLFESETVALTEETAGATLAAINENNNSNSNNHDSSNHSEANSEPVSQQQKIEQEKDKEDNDDNASRLSKNSRRISLVERQESWLANRQNKLYKQRKEQEEKMQKGFTFAPDMDKSKKTFQKGRTYRESSMAGAAGSGGASFEDLDVENSVVSTEKAPRQRSSQGRRPTLDRQSSNSSSTSKAPKIPKLRRRSSGDSRGSDKGRSKSKSNIKKRASVESDAQSIADEDTFALSRTQSIEYDDDATVIDDATVTDIGATATENQAEEINDKRENNNEKVKDKENDSKESDTIESEKKEETHTSGSDWGYQVIEDFVDKKKYVPKEFYDTISGGRGHLKIRSGHDFQMRTMYRKRDRLTRDRGVSLLVGRTEKPPHDEKVITIMFDLETFTEYEAFNWWHENKRRFADQQSVIRRMRYGIV